MTKNKFFHETKIEDGIDEILIHFDFDKVKDHMDAVNWTWALQGRVPEISEMKDVAKSHLTRAYEYALKSDHVGYTFSISSGGFKGSCIKRVISESIMFDFELEFIISDWDHRVV